MENRTMLRRTFLLAVFALVMSVVTSQNISAQTFKCVCDYVTIVTDDNVGCKFEVCNYTGGQTFCDYAIPGQRTRLRCIDGATLYVVNCRGERVIISADCTAPQIIAISSTCCVSVCVYRDANGCLVVHFSAAHAPCDKCPL